MTQTKEHWALKYIGIPFKEHGRALDGLDCWGLVRVVYLEQYEISLPTYTEDYDDIAAREHLANLYQQEANNPKNHWVQIEQGQEREGDVLLMPLAGLKTHVAVVIDPDPIEKHFMLHITEDIDVTMENYFSARWKHIYRRSEVYRHRRLMDD